MRYEILDILKERNDYVSGEEIGSIIGISRAGVWKNIKALKNMGYDIVSVTNRGYRLNNIEDVLCKKDIDYDKIEYRNEMESTNEEAKKLASKGCDDGLLVICNNQTKGKGRLGRSWQAEKNKGIYMSMVLYPPILPMDIPEITLVTGIAVMRGVKSATGLETKIKWPNDIIVGGKKLAGILCEMSAEMEKVNYVVIGIGINANNEKFSDEISEKATSVYIETGKKFRRCDIINSFLKEFKKCYNEFIKNGFAPFVNEYNDNCANIGREVKTVGGRTEYRGKAKGVNEKGELIIECENGDAAVMAGEVSLRLENGNYI